MRYGDNFRSSRERYPKLASIWAYRLQRHLDLWPTDHRSVNFSSMRRLRLEASSVLPGSIDRNSPEPAPQRGSASEDQDWRWSPSPSTFRSWMPMATIRWMRRSPACGASRTIVSNGTRSNFHRSPLTDMPFYGLGRRSRFATGEALYTAWDFKRLLDLSAVDIVQPDLTMYGGL